jgi:outer membrane lipoprotein-sorting protein
MQRFQNTPMTRFICILITGSAAVASAQGLKTTQQIVDFAESKSAAYKSWSGDYTETRSMFGNHMEVNGTVVQKPPHRVWMQLDMPIMGQHSQMTMVMGQDDVLWQVMKSGSQVQIMKTDMNKIGTNVLAQAGIQGNPADQFDPAKQLETTKGMCDFNVGAAGQLGGQPMYVLEGTLNQAALANPQMATMAAMVGKMRVFIGQTDGFVHRLEQYDKSQTNLVMAMEFTNLKFNQDVADSTFVYSPPPGAQVVDVAQIMSQHSSPPQGGDTASPSSPPPPAAK